jgi:hypothetical protein
MLSNFSKAIAGGVVTSALIVIAHLAGEVDASFVESALLPVLTVFGIVIAPRNKG